MVFLLTIPSSVGLAVLGDSMIAAVYQGGQISRLRYAPDRAGAFLLLHRSGRLCGAMKVLAPAFYALNDARTPMLVSLASILINAAAASSMVRFAGLGHAGLALSTSLVALFSSVALFEVIRRRIGGIQGRRLAR